MKIFLITYILFAFITPSKAVTTRMFKVLDTCARYRLEEIDTKEAIEKLKLKSQNTSNIELKNIISKYCAVFTPNQNVEY